MQKILKIMKRIIITMLLGVLIISCKTQAQYSMLSTLYQNNQQYKNYVTNGDVNNYQKSGQKLLQGISYYNGILSGSLTGRLGIIDSCKSGFDLLYGKTHDLPTFSLTAVSYLDLDSLLINGVKVGNFYSQATIQGWINTSISGINVIEQSGTPASKQLAEWVNSTTVKGGIYLSNMSNNLLLGGLMSSLSTGDNNNFYGLSPNLTSGSYNSSYGISLPALTIGSFNSGNGYMSLGYLISGSYNSAYGYNALLNLTTGNYNIGIGTNAGKYSTTKSNRVFINSIDRSNEPGDSTKSPIYIYQDPLVAKQRVDLNGNTKVTGNLTVTGTINGTGGSGTVDTVKVQSMIDNTASTIIDTLDHVTQAQLTAGLNGVSSNSDSNFISSTTDTSKTKFLNINSEYQLRTNNGLMSFRTVGTGWNSPITGDVFIFSTSKPVVASGVYFSVGGVPSLAYKDAIKKATVLPNLTDYKTGLGYGASGTFYGLGLDSTIYKAEYNSSIQKTILTIYDSMFVDGNLKAKTVWLDSIHTANGWHKNIISFPSTPVDSSLVGMTPTGDPFYFTVSGGVIGGIPTSVPTVNSLVSSTPTDIGTGNPKGFGLVALIPADTLGVTGNVTASTGITSAMLNPSIYYNGSSAIDITANPQIVDGINGQIIIIVGSSNTNTLKLDDGTGLALAGDASITLGIYDNIKLMYITALDIWVELSRSNN